MAAPRLLTFSLLALAPCTHSKQLWTHQAATAADVIRSAYPLGNGRLGVLPFGPAGSETLNLNIDSLWSGGPFESTVSPKSTRYSLAMVFSLLILASRTILVATPLHLLVRRSRKLGTGFLLTARET